ncbi:hypothetical protein DL93DRAFT_424518 [Clavulina sp. PMI_390]|nr:hypothetical protein DL93DRAFT_424518 [Clavulina sp. PMI_390]
MAQQDAELACCTYTHLGITLLSRFACAFLLWLPERHCLMQKSSCSPEVWLISPERAIAPWRGVIVPRKGCNCSPEQLVEFCRNPGQGPSGWKTELKIITTTETIYIHKSN